MGIVFDIKRYAIHDGPGIRCTVFLKGCRLRCKWCHNPEGRKKEPELIFFERRCLDGCDECRKVCETGAIFVAQDRPRISINRVACNLCGKCAEVCPSNALEVVGRKVSAEEVLTEIEKDRIFFEQSGGGVTFSGGEPLLQPEFLLTMLEKCKQKGFHTALDTSGHVPYETLAQVGKKVNLFLYDLKTMEDEVHRKYTGVSNTLILDNLKKLTENGKRVVIRIPLIPGVNDTKSNISRSIEFISALQGIEYISLLPYHRIAGEKHRRLSSSYEMEATEVPSEWKVKEIAAEFKKAGIKVKIGD